MNHKVKTGAFILLAIIFSASLVFTFSNSLQLKQSVGKLSQRLDKEVQELRKRTSPAVYVGEAVGYVIEFENGIKFYLSGDTGLSSDMKIVINDYYKPDVAVIPISGWFNMAPKEAAFATSLISPKKYVIPYHYASYPMLTADSKEFGQELKAYGLENKLLTLEIGKEVDVLGIKIVWLGHASLFLTSPEGTKILIDPTTKLGIWPEEYKDFKKFGGVSAVFLTHGHPDHVAIADLDQLTEMYQPLIFAQMPGYMRG